MHTYDPGNNIEVFASFLDVRTSAPVDPALITCIVRKPDGAQELPDVVQEAQGQYSAVIETDVNSPHGIWTYRFEGAVPAQGAREGAFYLRQSSV